MVSVEGAAPSPADKKAWKSFVSFSPIGLNRKRFLCIFGLKDDFPGAKMWQLPLFL